MGCRHNGLSELWAVGIMIRFPSFNSRNSIRTSMHVFDHTIKPILLYGSDIWGMFNPFTMKCKKENPSLDNIYSGSLCEKINL
jgi:hypothetical protein